MIYQIFKKNGDDFELVHECETQDEALTKLAFLRVDGGEYKLELNGISNSTVLGV